MEEAVISLSGVYEQEEAKEEMPGIRVDLTGLAGTTFFCEEAAAAQIRKALESVPLSGLHWIDSGDYHYVTLFFLERIQEPFTLLMLDHHSDMKESAFGAGLLSCGSWLLEALRALPLLRRVLLIGPADGEIPEAGEELFDRVVWIKEEELAAAGQRIAEELRRYPVYISLDKDVLDCRYCGSGWSQGTLDPNRILMILAEAFGAGRVLGIDICGEAPPKDGSFDPKACAVNRETNRYFRHKIKELVKGGKTGDRDMH